MLLSDTQHFRGRIFYFKNSAEEISTSYVWHEDGVISVQNERIVNVADSFSFFKNHPNVNCTDLRPCVLMPGLIDTHVHYPQMDIIASPAEGLLPWLDNYTFPAEVRYQDPVYARNGAKFFIDELMRQGTTTAMVYSTVHSESVEALFAEAMARKMSIISGKVLMDRNCPPNLRDEAITSIQESERLIQQWHGAGRIRYAITPRFACSSTRTQMQLAGELAQQFPEVYLQTHVAENHAEIAWARDLYPEARSYLDIYARYNMVRQRSMFGHAIWIDDDDRACLRDHQAGIAICPSSNLFLGSGLFDFSQSSALLSSLASDVGAGDSFSMLRTMNQAYKVARLKGTHLPGSQLFYLATLGAARALKLEHEIGHFAPGTMADFICIDVTRIPLLERRLHQVESVDEILFAIAMLGDDRCIKETWIGGVAQKSRLTQLAQSE